MQKKTSYIFFACSLLIFSCSLVIRGSASVNLSTTDIISKTNQVRIANGLPALTQNLQLSQAAEDKLADMSKQHYFAHDSPNGTTPWDWMNKYNYKFWSAGENLAANFSDSERLIQAWLSSPDHKENLLNPYYRDIGVGVRHVEIDGHNYTFVVQLFGAPQAISIK